MNSETNKFFVHESSYVDDGCEIGDNTSIWHFCHIISGTKIGERCNIGQNVVIGGNVIIGNGCKIQNNVSIYEGVELEDDVFCGPSMVFTNVFTPRSHVSRKNEYLPTPVRKGATIGANATIVCGNEIGAFAFIGAGSVVTKPVATQALVVGNPAKQIGWMCKCGERLPEKLHCQRCDTQYEIDTASNAIKEV
jgi:UDP-2-acetamido-3-amino-2,3-dideoxy-glucuronate N-acetyltransferase